MLRMESGRHTVLVLACLFLLPAVAAAQSTITGAVRDQSGALLPGVTVEAASEALIEGVRVTVTEGDGRYRITDLRPGNYVLTFSLPGFGRLVRDGIDLPSAFTATVNVELEVSDLEETITVTAEAPIVDTEQSTRTQILSRDLLDALPSGRTSGLRGAMLPGATLTTPDVGGARSNLNTRVRGFGMHDSQVTHQIDGFQVNSQGGGGGNLGYLSDASVQEVTVSSFGHPAEVSAGGIRMNNISRSGGDRFSGDAFLAGSTAGWQSSNLDPARHKNVRAPARLQSLQNFGASVGGPVLRERLWFYNTARHMDTKDEIINAFFPDGTPITNDNRVRNLSGRLTYQAIPSLRVAAFLDRIFKSRGRITSVGTDPLASATRKSKWGNYNFAQLKGTWTSARWVIEGGYSQYQEDYDTRPWPGTSFPRGTAEWLANARRQSNTLVQVDGCSLQDGCDVWGTSGIESKNMSKRRVLAASASHVTGSHDLKFGVQWGFGRGRVTSARQADLIQRYRGTQPIEVQVFNTPWEWTQQIKYDLGVYVQDTWRVTDRLTVNPGLRIENFNSFLPEAGMAAGRFVPARVFAAQENLPNWNGDLAPRFGAVYDLFGTGRTALKGTLSKYYQQWSDFAGRYNPVQNSSSVFAWRDPNEDDIAQEEEFLHNRGSNANFGLPIQVRAPDPDLRRAYTMEYALELTHEVMPRLAVRAGYLRRTWSDLESSRNSLVTRDDWLNNSVPFQVENPLIPGHMLTAYELNRSFRGQSFTVDFTDETKQSIYDALEVGWSARFTNGSNVYGAVTTERQATVDCSAASDPNAIGSDNYQGFPLAVGLQTGPGGERWCDQRNLGMPWRSMFKLAGNLPLPFDFQVAANLQSYAGREYAYTWTLQSFDFPGGTRIGTGQQLLLSQPGTLYYPRYNQLDLSLQKILRYRSQRYQFAVDLFNALNSSPILGKRTNVEISRTGQIDPRLDDVTNILSPRMLRLSLQFRF